MSTIDDIRHANLLLLIAEAGGQRALADTVAAYDSSPLAPAQISQWVTRAPDARRGKPRVLSSKSARRLEYSMGKPSGWMDQPHGDAAIPPSPTQSARPHTALSPDALTGQLTSLLSGMPDSARMAAGALLDALAKTPDNPALRTSLSHLLSSSSPAKEDR